MEVYWSKDTRRGEGFTVTSDQRTRSSETSVFCYDRGGGLGRMSKSELTLLIGWDEAELMIVGVEDFG